jgi:hypothetical protein
MIIGDDFSKSFEKIGSIDIDRFDIYGIINELIVILGDVCNN